jgi:pilus assembly protein FimV
MSRGPYPIVLMLAMSLPGAVRALGLGDIRVDSALNEPLSAQIDIVGATRDELIALTAKVANRDIFQRYGADRPAFLSSATFKVGLDAQGRPVLNVRSTDPFTDPLVSFLVDLRWGKNEVVREYSLLLDPPGYTAPRSSSDVEVAYAAPAAPAASVSQPAIVPAEFAAAAEQPVADRPKEVRTAALTDRAELDGTPAGHTHYKIASGDTLRGIARRAGARSESHVQRMMIAVFRANPNAFDTNINRMHRGAVLTLPTAAELAAISTTDAKREVHSQMTAWRLDGRPPASHRMASIPAAPAAAAAAAAPVAQLAPTAATAHEATEEATDASLKTRVQSLEQALDDMHKQLASENAKIQDLKQTSERVAAEPVTPEHAAPAAAHREETPKPILAAVSPQSMNGRGLLGPVAVTLALLIAGFAYVRRRFQHAPASSGAAGAAEDHGEGGTVVAIAPAEAVASAAAMNRTVAEAPRTMARIEAAPVPATVEPPQNFEATAAAPSAIPVKDGTETTVSLEVDAEALERSYLDSLGIDTPLDSLDMDTTPDSPDIDTTLETVAIDTSELDTAVMKADLNTMVIDTKKFDTVAADNTSLDYDLLELDVTAQHVHMPSDLHDHAAVSERRTNIVDVLKMAIERDPHRRDLRMKLLETYYSAASINQRAFVEVVKKLAQERDCLTADDWHKVKLMGREIASEEILFADHPKDDDELAHCA